MKKLRLFLATIAISSALATTALAGEWKQDETGWWYQSDDGTCTKGAWQWIDANGDGIAENYYFDAAGYCLMNTTTPDGYSVNAAGAWIVDGVVQTKAVETAAAETGTETATATQTAETQASTAKAASSQASSWNASYPYVDGMTKDSGNCSYVVNTNTGKVHKPTCSSVKDMKEQNTQYFNGTFSALTGAGYSSCGRCHAK